MTRISRFGLALAAGLALPLHAQPIMVALANGPVPDKPGESFDSFGTPRIDDTGRVWFTGTWGVALSSRGLFTGLPASPELLVQNRRPLPVAGLVYNGFSQVSVARNGIAGGVAIGTPADSDAIILIDAASEHVVHVDGDPSPTTEGTAFYRTTVPIAVDNEGNVSYSIAIGGTTNGSADDRALVRWNKSDATYEAVVREGDPLSAGSGFVPNCENSLRYFCGPASSATGPIGFVATAGSFLFDSSTGIEETGRIGFAAPGGGTYSSSSFAIPNSAGQSALSANIQGNSSYDAVFVYNNSVGSDARLGDPAPASAGGINGILRTPFSTGVTFGDAGEAVFYSDTFEPDPDGGNRIGEGLFAFDGSSLRSIARRYEPAPGGGVFTSLTTAGNTWVTNDVGQTLYVARIDLAAEGARTALFLDTPGQGSVRILATGDSIEGRTVTAIRDLITRSRGAGSLNDRGDVVVRVSFDTGSGIVVVPAAETCAADTNGDGMVSPADFNAWILAYNNRAPQCDQNGDALCTPADFNAWILNFNTGC